MEAATLRLDPITLKMTIRKGDEGSAPLRLTIDANDCYFWFAVKENIQQPDSEAPIFQTYYHEDGELFVISISEEESDRLSAGDCSSNCPCNNHYKDYIWALKYARCIRDENGTFLGTEKAKTLIPALAKRPPIFRVYPEIIEGPNL